MTAHYMAFISAFSHTNVLRFKPIIIKKKDEF